MKILCVFTLLLATAYCFSTILEEDWIAYKLKHEKSYPNEAEDRFRKSLFVKTTVEVFKNHLKYYNGSVGHKLEVNAFADVTETEFLRHKCGFMRQKERAESATAQFKFNETLSVPSSVDWRTMGAVTPVKDQKQCGSCWAFSATGALEGQNFIKNKKLISLSEQQMIDCGGKFEPYLGGCDGGLMESAFDYVKKTNGDSSDLNYPYKAVQNQCQFRASNVAVTCKGYIQVANNENAMMQAVATVGPISVSLSVNGNAGSYSQGIFPLSMCDVQNNHGVLIVGYGTNSKGVNYWIVKNSWGKGWGMGGYFLLQRGIKACGINQDPSYPLV